MNTVDLKTLLEDCDEELEIIEVVKGSNEALAELRRRLKLAFSDVDNGLMQMEVFVREKSADSPGNVVAVKMEGCSDGSIEIRPIGYGDCTSKKGYGCPVIIERWEGDLRLVVWGDINKEDPTHIISLEGAKESLRKDA